MDPGLYALLRCPSCDRDQMTGAAGRVACGACASEFPTVGGFIDLLDVTRRGAPTPSTAEQRLMESELVARIYERFWRPTFVRVIAGSGAGAVTGGFPGELFIHKNALAMEDRAGPWLDLSCGPGLFARAMAAAAPSSLVIGLDISRAMLEAAAHRSMGYGNVALIRADAHALPLVDGCLGGVNNAGALHAYDDPDHVFREILRVLSPGGVYVGSTFSQSTSLVGRLSARVAGIRRFDPLELRAHLSRLGFCEYDEIRLGDAFIFRVRKP